METKREAIGVVDAINAEDIGKFPDTNLSEALQRITGVSIDRRNGEGATVTARGFGPPNVTAPSSPRTSSGPRIRNSIRPPRDPTPSGASLIGLRRASTARGAARTSDR